MHKMSFISHGRYAKSHWEPHLEKHFKMQTGQLLALETAGPGSLSQTNTFTHNNYYTSVRMRIIGQANVINTNQTYCR